MCTHIRHYISSSFVAGADCADQVFETAEGGKWCTETRKIWLPDEFLKEEIINIQNQIDAKADFKLNAETLVQDEIDALSSHLEDINHLA